MTAPKRRKPNAKSAEGGVIGSHSDAGFHQAIDYDAPPSEAQLAAHRAEMRARGMSEATLAVLYGSAPGISETTTDRGN